MDNTILIIEDETNINDILSYTFTQQGYKTLSAYDGVTGLNMCLEKNPDLVLLDLMLPGLSGEEVLPHIQDVPVIVISAKIDVDSKVDLLMSGAVDYLTKPFDTKELVARIAVQLRKSESDGRAKVLKTGKLVLDEESHEVSYNGEPIKITKTEYAVLKILMANPNRTISKSGILDKISKDTPDCTEDSLKQHISNLRVKLRDVGGKDIIQAVWGIGYKLIAE